MTDGWPLEEDAQISRTVDYIKGHARPPGEHEIELSKAISLKRIADVICGDEKNTGVGMMLGFLVAAVERAQ